MFHLSKNSLGSVTTGTSRPSDATAGTPSDDTTLIWNQTWVKLGENFGTHGEL